jgi:hypothetical protein
MLQRVMFIETLYIKWQLENTRRVRVRNGAWEPAGSRTVNVEDIIDIP